MSQLRCQADRETRRTINSAVAGRPRMPESLERLLRSVNAMTWQPVLGLKGTGTREKVFRMGVFRADGPPRCESAELLRRADGGWNWSAWVTVPEVAVSLQVGGQEPNRKYAMRAAEKAFKRITEAAFGETVRRTKGLLALGARGTRH